MPLRASTNRRASQETSATRRAATRRRRQARQLARRRAAVLACFVSALVALAVGVHQLLSPARAPQNPPAEASIPSMAGAAASQGTHTQPVAGSAGAAVTGAYARPVRLIIPKIGLNAAIEDVGLTTGDAMAAPSGPDAVGWYKYGPRPGNRGSAVMDGHSGYAHGRVAAFDDLPKLSKGDKLYVQDASGKLVSFVVSKTQLYARDANAAAVFAPTASSRLNLITCTGSWDAAAGTHSQRLVVFADLVAP